MRRALAALVLAVALPLPGLADLVVQPGETLSEIAERNGVGLQQLMRVNGIQNPKLVQAGQRLVLPGSAKGGDAKGSTVVVQPGETLSEIAERNGMGLQQLMRLNGIQNPSMVEAGRRLVVAGGSTAAGSGIRNSRSFSYTVKEGETLSELAERYDTTVQLLLQRNRIGSPSELQAGSQLLIPGNRPTTSSGTSKPAGLAYSSKDKEHVVQAGESLSQIAEGYKLPLDRLVVINNISNPDLVISGTRLKLTAPPPLNPAKPTKPAKSTSVASQASQKPASPKPAPTKPAGAKPSAKAPTPANTAQSFPAAPTSKPQVAPQVVAAKPAAAQANPSNALTPSRAQAQTGPVQNSPAQTGRSASSAASSVAIAAAAKPAANAATTTATAAPTAAATSTAAATKSTTALTSTATATATAAAPTTNASAMAGVRVARGSSAPGSSAIGNGAAGTAVASKAAGGTATAGTSTGVTPTTGGAVATRALGGSKPQPSPLTTKSVGADWRTYGAMSVDWANWQSMGGSYVTPSLNGEGQPLYTAINCGARKLNATSQSGQWKTWESPRNDAEQQLVNDLCKAKGG
jgi:LysM repeat protein